MPIKHQFPGGLSLDSWITDGRGRFFRGSFAKWGRIKWLWELRYLYVLSRQSSKNTPVVAPHFPWCKGWELKPCEACDQGSRSPLRHFQRVIKLCQEGIIAFEYFGQGVITWGFWRFLSFCLSLWAYTCLRRSLVDASQWTGSLLVKAVVDRWVPWDSPKTLLCFRCFFPVLASLKRSSLRIFFWVS